MYDHALIEKSFKDEKTAIKTNKVYDVCFLMQYNLLNSGKIPAVHD